jgi:hypothetical protein
VVDRVESSLAGQRLLATEKTDARHGLPPTAHKRDGLAPLYSTYTTVTLRSSALARLLAFQSPRAICSARMTQVSLGGRPHRSERSQSPQVKSDVRTIPASRAETAAAMRRAVLVTDMASSYARVWLEEFARSEPDTLI